MGQRAESVSSDFLYKKSVDDSNLYYCKDKGSINITSKLEALGALFYVEQLVEF